MVEEDLVAEADVAVLGADRGPRRGRHGSPRARGENAAVLAIQMLALSDPDLATSMGEWREKMSEKVISDDESLSEA